MVIIILTMEKKIKVIRQNVIDFLRKYNLLKEGNTLLAGFSGGADSLCLLDILYKIHEEYGFKLAAAHLNHNWRGDESAQEAAKAENYCNERNIEFHTEILPAGLPQTEDEARNRRYDFFNKTAVKISATAILTGHTRTDNAETVLYRIIKGTGIIGLKGIPETRHQKGLPSIYRPLLSGLSREDCLLYCSENALMPNFDPSNYNQKYLRNRIRHSLLPELSTYNTAIKDSLLRLSQIANESEEIIEEYLETIRKDVVLNHKTIDAKNFLKLSNSLKKRVLVDFLNKNDIEHTFERIENLFCFIKENSMSKSGKTFSVGKNLWFFVSSRELKIIDHIKTKKTDLVIPVMPGQESFHPDLDVGLKIEKWQDGVPEKFPLETADTVFADLSEGKGNLFLRTRRPGDIIQPFGMKKKTKLKKYLINKGIPKHMRDELPMLADEKEVLWVAGVGVSELLRVEKIPTHIIKIKRRHCDQHRWTIKL